MNVKCELIDYSDRDKAYDNPRVVITDAGIDCDMVQIQIGDKTVKVSGKELIAAAKRCMNTNWPNLI